MRKKNILFSTLLLCLFSVNCTNTNKQTGGTLENHNFNREGSNQTVPIERSVDYYQSKGYQVFSDYQFAIKCPVILKDVSNESKDDHDFNYAGNTNDTFYQIMIIQIPAGRKELTRKEFELFLNEMFANQKCERVFWGEDGLPAYLFNDYVHNGYKGRGIAIPYNGKIYTLNLMTKKDLDAKFNSFTNNFKFLNEKDIAAKPILNELETGMKEYKQTGLGSYSISYPHDWSLIENPYKGVDVMILSPIRLKESEANINIIVSKNQKSLEESSQKAIEQMRELMPDFVLLSKEYILVDGMRCLKIVSKISMKGVSKISTSYQFKKDDIIYYTITSTINEEFLDNYKNTCNQIIKSFKLLNL